LNDRQFTSAVCASTVCDGLLVLLQRVSQIISFWSSATDPNKDSCSKCQATSWNGQYAVRDVKSIWTRLLRTWQNHIYIQKKRIKQYTYLNQLHTNYTLMTNVTHFRHKVYIRNYSLTYRFICLLSDDIFYAYTSPNILYLLFSYVEKILALAWAGWEKQWETSGKIASLPTWLQYCIHLHGVLLWICPCMSCISTCPGRCM